MRLVCSTLGVARSHLVALLKRPDDWIDRRTARSRSDDTSLLEDIRQVIHRLGTYGYRRVWLSSGMGRITLSVSQTEGPSG